MTTRKTFKPQDSYTAEQVRLTYSTWASMKQRCSNPNNTGYKYYGGRGITYDPAWESFDAFFADMGGRISREHTLDRINNNSDYTKSNCRWVKRRKQARNRNQNIIVTFKGCDFRLADLYYENAQVSRLAYASEVTYKTFAKRVKEGWSILEAASMQLHGTRKSKLRILAQKHGLKFETLTSRLRKGWSLRKALRTPADWYEKDTLAKEARARGLNPETVYKRLEAGWALDKALNTPNKRKDSVASKCREHNIAPEVVYKRLEANWSLEKALTTPVDITRRSKTK